MMPDDFDRLAAEHVLGTLDVDERREAERLAASDAEFQGAVARWRSRFAEFDQTAPPFSVDETFWRRIERSLDEAPATASATSPERAARAAALLVPSPASAFTALWRSLAFWRAAGLAAAEVALAVGLRASLLKPSERPALRPSL